MFEIKTTRERQTNPFKETWMMFSIFIKPFTPGGGVPFIDSPTASSAGTPPLCPTLAGSVDMWWRDGEGSPWLTGCAYCGAQSEIAIFFEYFFVSSWYCIPSNEVKKGTAKGKGFS